MSRAYYFLQVSLLGSLYSCFQSSNASTNKLTRIFVVEGDSGRTEWSSVAQRYGHPIEKFVGPDEFIPIRTRILHGTWKSGLAPLPSPQPISNPQTRAQQHFARLGQGRLETYQRRRLRGFTAGELVDMNVVTAVLEDKMAAGLDNPIHFMFERKRWLKMSDYRSDFGDIPILGDHDCFGQ